MSIAIISAVCGLGSPSSQDGTSVTILINSSGTDHHHSLPLKIFLYAVPVIAFSRYALPKALPTIEVDEAEHEVREVDEHEEVEVPCAQA